MACLELTVVELVEVLEQQIDVRRQDGLRVAVGDMLHLPFNLVEAVDDNRPHPVKEVKRLEVGEIEEAERGYLVGQRGP